MKVSIPLNNYAFAHLIAALATLALLQGCDDNNVTSSDLSRIVMSRSTETINELWYMGAKKIKIISAMSPLSPIKCIMFPTEVFTFPKGFQSHGTGNDGRASRSPWLCYPSQTEAS